MRETGVFLLYLSTGLILGAIFTYPLVSTGWVDHDPQHVMGRLAQVFILLGLWPFLKAMGLNDRRALGYGVSSSQFLNALWRGWFLGVSILLVLVLNLLLLEIRVPDVARGDWLVGLAEKSLLALLGGLLISLLEESFFRGAVYSAIRRNGGAVAAILWSSSLFALLHFMKPHALPDGVAFDWAGTWQMVLHVYAGVFQWQHVDSMVALFLVGVFLAVVRERTGQIGWCMGLHAGWIFVIQVNRYLTDGNNASPYAWLAGSYDGTIGWLSAAWIGLLALGLLLFARCRGRGHACGRRDTSRQ